MWWYLAPLVVLAVLVGLFGLLVFLGRFRNGVLLRPLVTSLSKIGFMRRLFTRMSTAAIEKQNPELAGALKKINTVASNPNPQAMQKAMSRLTPAERRAYLEASQSQGEEAPNRQSRRRVERMQQQARSSGGNRSARKRKRR